VRDYRPADIRQSGEENGIQVPVLAQTCQRELINGTITPSTVTMVLTPLTLLLISLENVKNYLSLGICSTSIKSVSFIWKRKKIGDKIIPKKPIARIKLQL